MAKKIVRGITDIKTISNQDFDTNNVNDLLSDGKHNYIHRKKQDGSEEYHNLTDNLKTISSDDTDLLEVTNDNDTSNSATIRPKHDSQKEQVLESTDETILIEHGENGTDETTSVDVNPAKVLKHDNLQTSYGISKTTSGNNTTLGIEYTKVSDGYDLNNLVNGRVRTARLTHAPEENTWFFVSSWTESNFTLQEAIRLVDNGNSTYRRLKYNGVWGEWREQVGDKSVIDEMLTQKEQVLESTDETILIQHGENGSDETTTVDVNPAKILEIVAPTVQEYSDDSGFLQTVTRPISATLEEFTLTVRLNKGETEVYFTLNEHDKKAIQYITSIHGINNQFNLNNSIFTFTGTRLQYFNNTTAVSYNNFLTTFTYIVPKNPTFSQQNTPNDTVEKGDIGTVDKVDVTEKVDEILDETVETEKVGKLEEIADKLVEKEQTE